MLDTALELKEAFVMLADDEDSKYKSYFIEDEVPDDELGEEGDYVEVQTKSKVSRKRVGPPTELFCQPYRPGGSEAERVLFAMSQKMRAKYTKYFASIDDINQLFLVALVLDPRYKLLNVERVCTMILCFEAGEVKRISNVVKELVVALTYLYATSNGCSSSQKSKSASSAVSRGSSSRYSHKKVSGKVADMLADWDKILEDGDAVVVGNEVDRYLLDPIEKPPKGEKFEFNLLAWWRLNGSKYPNLAAVAKDVLAVQVSTVASESSFNTAKRVIDPHWSSLTPKLVEALICLQKWLKSDSITSLAYVPTPEEMAWLEDVEKEQEKEEEEKKRRHKKLLQRQRRVQKHRQPLMHQNQQKK
ncbi:putative HAT dimerization domain, ribonuclease H-like domain, hAT-like transposase, RNase-H [Rosa chinensis]|uniref:Putative HAT dimerization domain, ribonuclease H-like domain, hAT-like transposase, RNase-H n=1 Tax=Rosa chinensis TaxID=74649 RepID=A0A2P6PU48_ROSCH|nr:putative HAT dimerization domain, ribonuclease H-like domain, hAT-like transposase, RNase-H [Rosa chinensis]